MKGNRKFRFRPTFLIVYSEVAIEMADMTTIADA